MKELGCLGLVMLFLQLTCPISCAEADDIKCLRNTFSQLKDPEVNLTWNFDNTTKGFACDFLGITCWHNRDNKVLEVSLPQMGFQGGFPTGLKSCRRITSLDLSQNSSKEMTFLEWIHGRFAQEGGCVEQAIDRYHVNDQTIALSDEESSVVAELMRAAFRCVNNNPDERPSMHEVYTWLRKIGERYSAISDDDEEISFQYDIKQNTNKKYF